MLFDLIFILIIIIFILILISIAFYNRLRVRDYYFSNEKEGDALIFTAKPDDYHQLNVAASKPLTFLPLYTDRKRSIKGELVLLTFSKNTSSEFYRVKVMNGTDKLSEGIYRIDPRLCYNSINFSCPSGNKRELTIQIQKYDVKLQKPITGTPANINLVKAWSYYY